MNTISIILKNILLINLFLIRIIKKKFFFFNKKIYFIMNKFFKLNIFKIIKSINIFLFLKN